MSTIKNQLLWRGISCRGRGAAVSEIAPHLSTMEGYFFNFVVKL